MTRKTKIMFLSLFLGISGMYAQTSNKPYSLGIHSGLNDYHGDLSYKWFDISAYRANVGVHFMYSLNPWLSTGLMANYGSLGKHLPLSSENTRLGMRSNLFHINGQLRLKMNNGAWLAENSKVQPYVYLGTGWAHHAIDRGDDNRALVAPGSDWTGNLGAGVTYMFNEMIGLNYNLNYAMTNHDRRDGYSKGKNDQFMQHTLGIVFNLGKKKDNTSTGTNKAKDSDGDGVADTDDHCPDVAGSKKNNGCPEMKKEVKEVVDKAVAGVQFETGKDVMLESSHTRLDAIAALMKANPAYKLSIYGHTDNTGSHETNMDLSQRRAQSVKNYLIKKGIDAKRMTTKGFGESKPKASNDTEEGRARNRRVEFNLHL
ncbi:MAG: OmpA family protein [Bacteroidetes bacterium]|nr:MAG: OmpA family protein [Bacteroidota bacterium]